MLEEKNDNLHDADGQELKELNAAINKNELANEPNTENKGLDELGHIHETEGQMPFAPEEVLKAGIKEEESTPKTKSAVEAIEDSNAEDSEDDSASDRHNIPMQNYEAFSIEKLTDELEKLVAHEKVMSVKEHVEEIKKEFYSKYNHLIEEKRDEYSHENDQGMVCKT